MCRTVQEMHKKIAGGYYESQYNKIVKENMKFKKIYKILKLE